MTEFDNLKQHEMLNKTRLQSKHYIRPITNKDPIPQLMTQCHPVQAVLIALHGLNGHCCGGRHAATVEAAAVVAAAAAAVAEMAAAAAVAEMAAHSCHKQRNHSFAC